MAPKRKAPVVVEEESTARVDPALQEDGAEETSPPESHEQSGDAHPPPPFHPYQLPPAPAHDVKSPSGGEQPSVAIPPPLPAGYYGVPYGPWGFQPMPFPGAIPGMHFPPPPPGYQLAPYLTGGQVPPPMPTLLYGPAPVPAPPPQAGSAASEEGDGGYSEAEETSSKNDDEYKPEKKKARKTRAVPYDPDSGSKKANIACNYCRKRKIKCDETRPICVSCQRLGQECQYDDTRRFRGKAKSTVIKEKKSARMSARHKANSYAKEMPPMRFTAVPMPGEPPIPSPLNLSNLSGMPLGEMPKFMFWNAPANVGTQSS